MGSERNTGSLPVHSHHTLGIQPWPQFPQLWNRYVTPRRAVKQNSIQLTYVTTGEAAVGLRGFWWKDCCPLPCSRQPLPCSQPTEFHTRD